MQNCKTEQCSANTAYCSDEKSLGDENSGNESVGASESLDEPYFFGFLVG